MLFIKNVVKIQRQMNRALLFFCSVRADIFAGNGGWGIALLPKEKEQHCTIDQSLLLGVWNKYKTDKSLSFTSSSFSWIIPKTSSSLSLWQESEDLELCFTLDRIVETTEEEKCFQVICVRILWRWKWCCWSRVECSVLEVWDQCRVARLHKICTCWPTFTRKFNWDLSLFVVWQNILPLVFHSKYFIICSGKDYKGKWWEWSIMMIKDGGEWS